MAEAYQTADSITRCRIADEFIAKIHKKGGRFLQSITAANALGEVVTVWEVVSMEKSLTKIRQALRDVVTDRHFRREVPAPCALDSESQRHCSERAAASSSPTIPPQKSYDSLEPSPNNIMLHGSNPTEHSVPAVPMTATTAASDTPLQLRTEQQLLFALDQQQKQNQQLQSILRAAGASNLHSTVTERSMITGQQDAQQRLFPPASVRLAFPVQNQSMSWNANHQFPLTRLMLIRQQEQVRLQQNNEQLLSARSIQQHLLPFASAGPRPHQTSLEPISADLLFRRVARQSEHPEEASQQVEEALKRSASDAELDEVDQNRKRQNYLPDGYDPFLRSLDPPDHAPEECFLPRSQQVGLPPLHPAVEAGFLPTATVAPAPPDGLGQLVPSQEEHSSPDSFTSSGATSLLAAVVGASVSAAGRNEQAPGTYSSDGTVSGTSSKISSSVASNSPSEDEITVAAAASRNGNG